MSTIALGMLSANHSTAAHVMYESVCMVEPAMNAGFFLSRASRPRATATCASASTMPFRPRTTPTTHAAPESRCISSGISAVGSANRLPVKPKMPLAIPRR